MHHDQAWPDRGPSWGHPGEAVEEKVVSGAIKGAVRKAWRAGRAVARHVATAPEKGTTRTSQVTGAKPKPKTTPKAKSKKATPKPATASKPKKASSPKRKASASPAATSKPKTAPSKPKRSRPTTRAGRAARSREAAARRAAKAKERPSTTTPQKPAPGASKPKKTSSPSSKPKSTTKAKKPGLLRRAVSAVGKAAKKGYKWLTSESDWGPPGTGEGLAEGGWGPPGALAEALDVGRPAHEWETLEDIKKSLNVLAKYNDGLWKSEKQGSFLTARIRALGGSEIAKWAERQGYSAKTHVFLDAPWRINPRWGSKATKMRVAYQGFVCDAYGLVVRVKAKVEHPRGVTDPGEAGTYEVRWETVEKTFERQATMGPYEVDVTGERARKARVSQMKEYEPLYQAVQRLRDEYPRYDTGFTRDMQDMLAAGRKLSLNQMATLLKVLGRVGLVPKDFVPPKPDIGAYEEGLKRFISWVERNIPAAEREADRRVREKIAQAKETLGSPAAGESFKEDTARTLENWQGYDYKREFRRAWEAMKKMSPKKVKARTNYDVVADFLERARHSWEEFYPANPVADVLRDKMYGIDGGLKSNFGAQDPVGFLADMKYGIRTLDAGKRVRRATKRGMDQLLRRGLFESALSERERNVVTTAAMQGYLQGQRSRAVVSEGPRVSKNIVADSLDGPGAALAGAPDSRGCLAVLEVSMNPLDPENRLWKTKRGGGWFVRQFGSTEDNPSMFTRKADAIKFAIANAKMVKERGVTDADELAVLRSLAPKQKVRRAPKKARLSTILKAAGGEPPGGWEASDTVESWGRPGDAGDRRPFLAEAVVPFDEMTKRLRADYLLLMTNVDRVRNGDDLKRLYTGLVRWHNYLEGVVSGERAQDSPFLRAYYAVDAHGTRKDMAEFHRGEMAIAVNELGFYIAQRWLGKSSDGTWGVPGVRNTWNFRTKKHEDVYDIEEWNREKERWKKRADRRARKLWKAMRDASAFLTGLAPDVVPTLRTPSKEVVKMEGATLVVTTQTLRRPEMWRKAIKDYRERTAKVFPWAWKHLLPLHVVELGLSAGGTYNTSHIRVNERVDNPERLTWVIAHEMGHHIYKVYLSGTAKAAWVSAVESDREMLDLRRLLSEWPENIDSVFGFEKHLKAQRKWTRFWQLRIIHWHYDPRQRGADYFATRGEAHFRDRAGLQELVDSGVTAVDVPAHPVTAYAAKNPEEAMCEAFAALVANGPRRLDPMVLGLLREVMGGDLRGESWECPGALSEAITVTLDNAQSSGPQVRLVNDDGITVGKFYAGNDGSWDFGAEGISTPWDYPDTDGVPLAVLESWGRRGSLSENVPAWVQTAASRGETFVGPNGNEAIAYEWKWKWGLKPDKEGALVDARVSDWDEALQCATCGRRIVHIYWVRDKDTGVVDSYGVEHLHTALGYPRAVSKRQQKEILKSIDARGLADKRVASKMTRLTNSIAKLRTEADEKRALLAAWERAQAQAMKMPEPPIELVTDTDFDVPVARMGDAEVWLQVDGGKLTPERERQLKAEWQDKETRAIFQRETGERPFHPATARNHIKELDRRIAKAEKDLHALMPGKVTQDVVGESWGRPGALMGG